MMYLPAFLLLLSAFLLCLPFHISSAYLAGWIAWAPALTLFFHSSRSLVRQKTLLWFLRGWAIGAIWYGSLFYWLPETLYVKAGVSFLLTTIFSLGTVGFLASFPAVVLALCSFFQSFRCSPYLSFPILFTMQEWLLEYVPFGGIPWGTMAASQPLGKWQLWVVSHFGGIGLTFLMTAMAALLAYLLVHGNLLLWQWSKQPVSWRLLSIFILISGVMLLAVFIFSYVPGGAERSSIYENPGADEISVLLVPGDVSIANLNDPAMLTNILQEYLQHSLNQTDQTALVIWPENAYPGIIERGKNLVNLFHAFSKMGTDLILGSNAQGWIAVDQQYQQRRTAQHFNSAYLVYHRYFEFERYDKRQLVPFGEYVPVGWKWLIPHNILPQVPDYIRGKKTGIFYWKDTPLGIFICFETIFSRLVHMSVQEGSQFLVGISNGQWLNNWATWHHLRLTTLRAAEVGRDMVLVGNGGKTAHIQVDTDGVQVQPLDEPATVRIKPQSYNNWYVLYGIWPSFGLMGGYLLIFLFLQFRTRRNHTIQ